MQILALDPNHPRRTLFAGEGPSEFKGRVREGCENVLLSALCPAEGITVSKPGTGAKRQNRGLPLSNDFEELYWFRAKKVGSCIYEFADDDIEDSAEVDSAVDANVEVYRVLPVAAAGSKEPVESCIDGLDGGKVSAWTDLLSRVEFESRENILTVESSHPTAKKLALILPSGTSPKDKHVTVPDISFKLGQLPIRVHLEIHNLPRTQRHDNLSRVCSCSNNTPMLRCRSFADPPISPNMPYPLWVHLNQSILTQLLHRQCRRTTQKPHITHFLCLANTQYQRPICQTQDDICIVIILRSQLCSPNSTRDTWELGTNNLRGLEAVLEDSEGGACGGPADGVDLRGVVVG